MKEKMKKSNSEKNIRKILMILLVLVSVMGSSGKADWEAPDNEIREVELMDYTEEVYDTGNGMVTSEANTVLQDSRGYIWVGSYGGLLRYCGHQFINMSTQRDGAPESGVRVLFEDAEGSIWIGTNDAGVYLYKNAEFSRVEGKDQETKAQFLSVRTITEDQNGTVYVGTTSGLFRENKNGRLEAVYEQELQKHTVSNLLFDTDGILWGVTENDLLFVVKEEKIQLIDSLGSRSLQGLNLSKGLEEAENGDIYLGTEDNIVIRVKKSGTRDLQKRKVELLSTGNRKTVNDIYQDTQGKLWICTDNGIGYFDDKDVFREVYDLSSDTIMDEIMEDYEGNLWFASSRRGLIKLSRSKFKNVGYEAGVDNQTVNASVLYHNSLYIGTDNGLSIMDEYGERVENTLTRELSGIRIRSFMLDSKENLWISTYREKGLICYNDREEEWFSVTEEQGMPTEKLRMILELQNGDIAVATNNGVAVLNGGNVTKVYSVAEGIENEVILCLAQRQDGNLLAGSDGNGIYEINLETDEVKNITADDGLTSGVILNMVSDKEDGGIWISNGVQLSYMKEQDIRTLPSIKEVSGSIFDIKIDGDTVWLLKSSGLIKADRESLLKGKPEYEAMTRKDGLISGITANSSNYISKDGMLFLCTGNGIYYIDTKEIYQNTARPRVAIGAIDVDGQQYYIGQDIVVPADTKKITISLELLSFGFGEGSLEYYLEGFDESPISIRTRIDSSVNYTNLPGGKYTFHLKGYNSDGVESDELTFQIRKEHSIYERGYLYALIAAATLLVLLSGIIIAQHVHKKRMLKRQQEYKNLTDQSIDMIAKIIDAKDKYTIGHSKRVAIYAVEIGKRVGLSQEQLEQLHYSALLHDIGKIGIPDQILNKKGKLTDEEFAIIKQHPAIGGKILKDFTLVPWISAGAEFHHERYDGKGYNKGLKAEEIPLYARIICVADAFDCMNSTRVYRPSMTEEVIYQELEKGKGTQFDEKFAEIMMQMMREHFKAEI